MTIEEITMKTEADGSLSIPPEILMDSGIEPGTEISLAWISDGKKGLNIYRELLISRDGISGMLEPDEQEYREIQIPIELLKAAGIADDEDVIITCVEGVVLISGTDSEKLIEQFGEFYAKQGGDYYE